MKAFVFIRNIEDKEDEMGRACSTKRKRNAYRILV
jgi:hypothetical protein